MGAFEPLGSKTNHTQPNLDLLLFGFQAQNLCTSPNGFGIFEGGARIGGFFSFWGVGRMVDKGMEQVSPLAPQTLPFRPPQSLPMHSLFS